MSLEETPAPAGGEALPEIPAHSPAGDGPLSARDAARSLADARYKREAEQNRQAEQPQAPPEQELPAEGNAAPPEEATGETQDNDPAPELPPIDRPRSWSKEKESVWAKLDRETQEYLAEHDREVSKGVRNAQNEAAEKLKGLTAKEQAVEQARQQYESALPILMQNLQSAMAGEFSDIMTMADVQRMANEDFPRYVRWDAQQKQIAAVQQEVQAAQYRQTSEKKQKLNDFIRHESELFAEKAPEIADEAQRSKLQTAAVSVLKDLGFKDDELAALWSGDKELSIHDHRLHLLIRDGVKLREAQKARATVVAAKPPPVQRPGVAPPKGADKAAQIQALEQQLSNLTGMAAARKAAEITRLRRAG